MITGLAVSVLLLHHYRRVATRRAVNYDYAGALIRELICAAAELTDQDPLRISFIAP